MCELFGDYLGSIAKSVPLWTYEAILSLFVIGSVSLFCANLKNKWTHMARLFLVCYVILLLCSTVFFRQTVSEYRYNISPFWSYGSIYNGMTVIIPEVIMNIIVFIPIGLALVVAKKNMVALKVVLFGTSISVAIEFFQIMLKKGCMEIDDVIHNTVGCIIGYGLYESYIILKKRFCYESYFTCR